MSDERLFPRYFEREIEKFLHFSVTVRPSLHRMPISNVQIVCVCVFFSGSSVWDEWVDDEMETKNFKGTTLFSSIWMEFKHEICRIEINACNGAIARCALDAIDDNHICANMHTNMYAVYKQMRIMRKIRFAVSLRGTAGARAHLLAAYKWIAHRFNRIPIDVVISVMNAPGVIFPSCFLLLVLLFGFAVVRSSVVRSWILRHVASHFRFHSLVNSPMKRFSSTHIYSKA